MPMPADPTDPTDPTSERFALLEMDGPPAVVRTPAPKAAPTVATAPAPAPTALTEARALIDGAATMAALTEARRVLVARYPDKAHPVRAALRPTFEARVMLVVGLWWLTFANLWRDIGRAMPTTPVTTVAPEAEAEADGGDLLSALGAIGAEGAANVANAAPAARMGSIRAAGQVIPQNDRPVGTGIVHRPEGRAVGEMTPAEARAHFDGLRRTPTVTASRVEADAAEALTDDLQAVWIAGLVADGNGLAVSAGAAIRGVLCERAPLVAALDAAGLGESAPTVKTSKAQFGAVCGRLNGGGLRSWAAKKRNTSDWPTDVVSRWIVGTTDDAAQLGSLGDKELIAELTTDGAVRFVGGSEELRERVTSAFGERVAGETYTASDLLGWFKYQLGRQFAAIEWGGFLYCPGSAAQCATVRHFVDTALPFLGREVGVGELASKAGMAGGISRTLGAEVAAVRRAFDGNTADAVKAATRKAIADGLSVADQELAARRAECSPEAARHRLADLGKVAARVEGFAALIGPDLHAPLKAALAALRSELERIATFVELELD